MQRHGVAQGPSLCKGVVDGVGRIPPETRGALLTVTVQIEAEHADAAVEERREERELRIERVVTRRVGEDDAGRLLARRLQKVRMNEAARGGALIDVLPRRVTGAREAAQKSVLVTKGAQWVYQEVGLY
jgi:hypothetical protein